MIYIHTSSVGATYVKCRNQDLEFKLEPEAITGGALWSPIFCLVSNVGWLQSRQVLCLSLILPDPRRKAFKHSVLQEESGLYKVCYILVLPLVHSCAFAAIPRTLQTSQGSVSTMGSADHHITAKCLMQASSLGIRTHSEPLSVVALLTPASDP